MMFKTDIWGFCFFSSVILPSSTGGADKLTADTGIMHTNIHYF